MKQSISKQSHHSRLLHEFDEQEFEVCEVLLDLHNLVFRPFAKIDNENDASVTAALNWGARRRRSRRDAPPPSPPHHYYDVAASPPPPPMKVESHVVEESQIQDKVEASSPATPLSFPASESDDKSNKHSYSKSSKKRTREELLEIIQGLTQSQQVLIREVETVRSYHKQLQDFNMALKATKQKLKDEEHLNRGKSLNICGKNSGQHHLISMVAPLQQQRVISPVVLGSQMREEEYQYQYQYQYPYLHQYGQLVPSSSAGNHITGKRGIPFDLNVSAEEAFGLDSLQPFDHAMMTREDSKEKRRQRKLILSNKKVKC